MDSVHVDKDLVKRVIKFHHDNCRFKGFSIMHVKKPTMKQYRDFVKWYLKYADQFIDGVVASSESELSLKLAARGY